MYGAFFVRCYLPMVQMMPVFRTHGISFGSGQMSRFERYSSLVLASFAALNGIVTSTMDASVE